MANNDLFFKNTYLFCFFFNQDGTSLRCKALNLMMTSFPSFMKKNPKEYTKKAKQRQSQEEKYGLQSQHFR